MREINYKELPEADVIINYIKRRRKRGLYTLILTTGLPGTGKSSIDIRLAELISLELTGKNIITEVNIIDDVLALIKFLKNANEKEVSIGVIEEISVLFPSRRAMSHDNVVVGKLLDTAKALRMQTNPGSGKTYFHWLKRKGKEVHRIFVRKPNSETWKGYEERKDKFLDELYKDLMKKTLKKRGKEDKGTIVKPLSPREIEAYDLVIRQGLKHKQAAEIMGIDRTTVTKLIKNIKYKTNFQKEVKENLPPNNSQKELINTPIPTPSHM